MMAAGAALGRQSLVDEGAALLAWLLDHETNDGHLSVTPVDGSGPRGLRPAFDQQPIEVAALADACARADDLVPGDRWARGIDSAVAWFLGDNDAGAAHVGPRHRRGLRRAPCRRAKPQPRSGVDIGVDLYAATWPPPGSVPPLTVPEQVEKIVSRGTLRLCPDAGSDHHGPFCAGRGDVRRRLPRPIGGRTHPGNGRRRRHGHAR